jgi:hypothetical protein
MGNAELLVSRYPEMFHVTANGGWTGIQEHGLLSTEQALDLYEVPDELRNAILSQRRDRSHVLRDPDRGVLVVRDQLPLSLKRLENALTDMTLDEWLTLLNTLCYFWPTRTRVETLLATATYAQQEHEVLVVDTAELVRRHHHRIRLAPLNTGATRPFAHPRGRDTFLPIDDYPLEDRLRRVGKAGAVAEVAVVQHVSDLAEFTLRVERWRGPERLSAEKRSDERRLQPPP